MKVRVPYSRTKRYLTGIDWTILTLDRMSYRATGGSNASQIVMELRGKFDDHRFRAAMTEFTRQFPVLGGRSTRDWNLAPYWKIPRAGTVTPVQVDARQVTRSELLPALAESVNTRFTRPDEHLACRVFHVEDDVHYLAMRFDHRLFDAQGAEAFLDLFQRWYSGENCRARLAGISLTAPAHLSEWKRKFEAGKQLVRMLLGFNKTTLVVLPRPSSLKGRRFKFSLMEFDGVETGVVTGRAYREAGFLMFMPYALACAIQALDSTFKARAQGGQDYIVSVSVDLRAPDTAASHLFFNHLSFLIFRIPAAVAGDRRQVLEAIRSQMYEQVKSGFPRALAEASMLMRILPPALLSHFLLKPLHGEFASLGFSCVGKGGANLSQFMETAVNNLFHMPLVPVPPGVGFVVNQFGNRMNAVLSYVDGMLSDEEVQRIQENVRRRFQGIGE
jgi:hypothetical protein